MTGLIATFADFVANVGAEFVGEWHQISEERTRQFFLGSCGDLSYGDALGEDYPDGLVEGFHVLSLLDWLAAEIIGRWHGLNYGLDRVRFVTPILQSHRIRLRLRIERAVERGAGLLITYDAIIEIDGNDRPGMVARWLVLNVAEAKDTPMLLNGTEQ